MHGDTGLGGLNEDLKPREGEKRLFGVARECIGNHKFGLSMLLSAPTTHYAFKLTLFFQQYRLLAWWREEGKRIKA
ncbi:hypothetical protein GQ457_12G015310 [Hibiscus cannabinus]